METPARRPDLPTALLGGFFLFAGVMHFLKPQVFDRLVPPGLLLPARTATLVSGAAEVAGGVGFLLPATRPAARLGLLALLVAVFPANVYMAQEPQKFGVPAWAAWARLPLQPLLFWWVLRTGRSPQR